MIQSLTLVADTFEAMYLPYLRFPIDTFVRKYLFKTN